MAKKLEKQKTIPKNIQREALIAQRVLSDLASVNALGEQAPFNCPACGGGLWKIDKGSKLRYSLPYRPCLY
ncbi:hypothetical protein [Mucilaginibacter flavidus]|uniref:hypothetical protein n=1 Tax=Mucilaginibacter flavidus TaxID=2949309 RepID=UPI00209324C5|nr:hypothetical protein [Mucilaginibacter flavidus]MCO5951149.1 hypothetical protein [Mucilaginibacter flavidus]